MKSSGELVHSTSTSWIAANGPDGGDKSPGISNVDFCENCADGSCGGDDGGGDGGDGSDGSDGCIEGCDDGSGSGSGGDDGGGGDGSGVPEGGGGAGEGDCFEPGGCNGPTGRRRSTMAVATERADASRAATMAAAAAQFCCKG